MDPYKSITTRNEAKEYMAEKEIPQLFESMLTGLMYSRPEDPLKYLEDCINKSKEMGLNNVTWDAFALKKDSLPPISPREGVIAQSDDNDPKFMTEPPSTLNPYAPLPPIIPGREEDKQQEEEAITATTEYGRTGDMVSSLPESGSQAKPLRTGPAKMFLLIGGPGAGKKSLLNYMVDSFEVAILSLGDLIEDAVRSGSEIGVTLRDHMDKAEEIPEHLSLQLVQDRIRHDPESQGFVLNGFPRSFQQLHDLQKEFGNVSGTLVMEQSDEMLLDKLQKRSDSTYGHTVPAEDQLKEHRDRMEPILAHLRYKGDIYTVHSTLSAAEQKEVIRKCLTENGLQEVEEGAEEDVPKEAVDEVLVEEQHVDEDQHTGGDSATLPPESQKLLEKESVSRRTSPASFVFFIGGSTSGKEEHLEEICKETKFTGLTINNMIENEVESGNDLGEAVKDVILRGEVLPEPMALEMVKKNIASNPESPGFILDGFPRSPEQISQFEDQIGKLSFGVYLKQEDEAMRDALTNRARESGESSDDVAQQIDDFHAVVDPLLDHLEQHSKLFTVNTSQPMEAQRAEIKEAFMNNLIPVEVPDLQESTENAFESKTIVFVIGGPGSGKGTQCAKIVERMGYTHLSSGDLLRDKVASGTPEGNELQEIMNSGKLVPLDKVLELIKEAMTRHVASGSKGFLIDGYPRDVEQGVKFEETIAPCTFVINFEVDDEELVKRLLGRAETSGRVDDNEETIKQRIVTFREHSVPVAEYYATHQKLHTIDASRPIDEVFKDVMAVFGETVEDEPSEAIIVEEGQETAAGEETVTVEETAAEKSQEPKQEISVPIVFVIGGPGSGKGTQCDKIVEKYGFTHLSSGDLLREKVASGSEEGEELKKIMEDGKLVPLEKVLELIKEAMLAKVDTSSGFLIDGYPREVDQGIKFEAQVAECAGVVNFDVRDEILVERLLERAKTSGRDDDNEETIKKRLQTFRESSVPVAEYYASNQKLCTIDADRSIDDVFADVQVFLDKLLSAPVEQAAPALEEKMSSPYEKLPIVFVTGGPGSGKGTQCDKIVQTFGLTHLSSGDLLRAKVASGSPDGLELEEVMKQGKLVPLEKVLDLVVEAMEANAPTSRGFLIDGYPRDIEQGIKFEEKIAPCSLVIDFDVPDETLVARLLKRGETSGRADDNEETIRARLGTYREATVPVADYYSKLGKLVRIDADRDVEVVFSDVKATMLSNSISPVEQKITQPVFFVVGGPGSGKGTQCAKIVEEFGYSHLSSGDLLRAEVASGSEKGQALERAMKEGELVTMETVLELLKTAMLERSGQSKGFLIDGYPRKVEQGELFENMIAPCAACIYFEVSDEEMKERLRKRGETSGRADDNEETIQKRLVTFQNETRPVVEHYSAKGVLHQIDAHRSIEDIYTDVQGIMAKFNPSA